MNALKNEEVFAAEAFERFISDSGRTVDWTPGDDPPDLEFRIDGDESWAVEVTTLHQYFEFGGSVRPRVADEKPLIQMCERIRQSAAGITNSDYIVVANGPLAAQDRKQVEEDINEYCRARGRGARRFGPHGEVLVKSIDRPVRAAFMVGIDSTQLTPDSENLIVDIDANIEHAIGRILDDKIPVLRQFTKRDRRMLLIVSQHFFADAARVGKLLGKKDISTADIDCVTLIVDGEVHCVWGNDPCGPIR